MVTYQFFTYIRSLLKIWNMNKFSGVIGVFNCQGAGSWPCLKDDTIIPEDDVSVEVSGQVSPTDIEHFDEICGDLWTRDCAVYSSITGALSRLSETQSLSVTLKTLECNVFVVSPIKVYAENIQFAPLGLIDMYNSGGAIYTIELVNDSSTNRSIRIKGKGVGRVGAYSDLTPNFCIVNSKKETFDYSGQDCLLTTIVPYELQESWGITIGY